MLLVIASFAPSSVGSKVAAAKHPNAVSRRLLELEQSNAFFYFVLTPHIEFVNVV